MDTNFSATDICRDPALRGQPLDFEKKLNAIVYINTQCAAKSGRQDVVRQLQAWLKASNSTLAVHSFGKCDPNMPADELKHFQEGDTGNERLRKKLAYFQRYKFCIVSLLLHNECMIHCQQAVQTGLQHVAAMLCQSCHRMQLLATSHHLLVMGDLACALQTMENSVTRDYVTEKVYDGLVAGCVPVYLGAPNIGDYIPDSNAIVDYAKLGSPEALKQELERLASDQEAYEEKLMWKRKGERHWTPGESHNAAY